MSRLASARRAGVLLLGSLLLPGRVVAQAPPSEPPTATFPPVDGESAPAPASAPPPAPDERSADDAGFEAAFEQQSATPPRAAEPRRRAEPDRRAQPDRPAQPRRRRAYGRFEVHGSDAPSDTGSESDSESPDDRRGSGSRRPAPPILGIGFGTGLAFGGETLITAFISDGSSSKLDAGEGVSLSARAFVSPVWINGDVGIGLGLDFGWKYASVGASNATIGLTRFPLLLTGRLLLRASDAVMLLAAGGVHYESGPTLSASGDVQGEATFDEALGGTFEGGLLVAQDHLGFELTLRHTELTYRFMGARADASHTGIFTGLFYVL